MQISFHSSFQLFTQFLTIKTIHQLPNKGYWFGQPWHIFPFTVISSVWRFLRHCNSQCFPEILILRHVYRAQKSTHHWGYLPCWSVYLVNPCLGFSSLCKLSYNWGNYADTELNPVNVFVLMWRQNPLITWRGYCNPVVDWWKI